MNIYVFDSLIDPAFFMMHSYFKKNRLNEIIYLNWQEFNYRKRTRLQFRIKWPPAIFCFQVEKWSMLLCDQSDSKIETKKKKKKHELFWVCLALKGWKISFVIPFIVCYFSSSKLKGGPYFHVTEERAKLKQANKKKQQQQKLFWIFFSFNGRTI